MEINEYQKLAMRTANDNCRTIANAGLGIAGEAGEAADIIKKYLFHGHELDKDELIKELGDVCWYVALTAELIGVDLETVLERNIDKLKRRYPTGFSEELSINRKE
jgi:NTP pyrophosphatase (non-canonical NTP hydrolase)